MLKVVMYRVKPEKEQRLREWLLELTQRRHEVRETFIEETVRHEQAYLITTSEGLILIYAIEAEDLERGQNAFLNSTHPIDLEHKQVMQEVLIEPVSAELLYDC